MMHRHSLLLGGALLAVASTGHAQSGRSREDLLDELTRHIQICSEIGDSQQRLACYDKVQTQVGDVSTPAPSAPQPTPLATSRPPAPQPLAPPPAPSTPEPTTGGSGISGTPLSPPPLTVPGGGVATLGGSQMQPAPTSPDPDRAFDPTASAGSGGPIGPPPQPTIRRTGPRPIPYSSQQMPLITLSASNLTYGNSRHWQVSISITSNTPKTVDTQIQCTFRNAGRSVGEAYFGPTPLAPGEQISTELYGPPTTAYVDSVNCRALSP
ncbi:hypothetical protein SAMN02745126_01053 [Enhydrobacter aerosaccus]|uniref:Cellulose binding domain-containing protein n=1 Tax=Enhydrobacter aerosaccus TaxID=225324 RepID=A0A1T4KMP7_9HYPH|nr:hypothetical protein [Enhydrobacter aerosaccus]SJZ43675.1 hypothetical protein SAMN02745126_01053 [Enhydrobacter aerosaccus]